MVYLAERIAILRVLLYCILIYKMHLRLKLGNNIMFYVRELIIKQLATLKYITIDCCLVF